ncbi:hypothetical protein LR48_Vigan187s002900 [Vigna angularis]|uniref:Secreted protein n=1 Tax=Phaseolus angularis TaxID=3914 RepID=A0A0L9T6Q0_PHAAN|nr:hypothetical protein LR48_Vigan187s002900 [Vigna angularis]
MAAPTASLWPAKATHLLLTPPLLIIIMTWTDEVVSVNNVALLRESPPRPSQGRCSPLPTKNVVANHYMCPQLNIKGKHLRLQAFSDLKKKKRKEKLSLFPNESKRNPGEWFLI